MFREKTDRSDVHSLNQTGTDEAKGTFCLIPKMLVECLSLVCVCVFLWVCAILHYAIQLNGMT